MEQVEKVKKEVTDFLGQSQDFMTNCTKPEMKGKFLQRVECWLILEFAKMAYSCAIGFAIMGVVGFAIKLIFIPINNILLN